MNFSKIDKNFDIKSEIRTENIEYYDVCKPPFKVYGFINPEDENDRFRRMPEEIAKTVSEGVYALSANTAGGRVRFKTNSKCIAIHAEMPTEKIWRFSDFPLTGSAGFDLYAKKNGKQKLVYTFIPPLDIKNGYESEYIVQEEGLFEYTLNFPLYSDVSKLYIALEKDAVIGEAEPYKYEKPIVFYGSSITQGACASRPGNSYENIISRRLDCNYLNLGFSGGAKGEDAMAEYLASLDMSVLVYDYDYNAPTPEHLEATHKRMFDKIRVANPELPIVCVSRPVYFDNYDCNRRREIIMNTVNSTKKSGDNNVYFIDGKDFENDFSAGDSISVDLCHPNDLGFMCMANHMCPIIEKLLK